MSDKNWKIFLLKTFYIWQILIKIYTNFYTILYERKLRMNEIEIMSWMRNFYQMKFYMNEEFIQTQLKWNENCKNSIFNIIKENVFFITEL